jgi:hypothetical protein
MGHSTVPKVGSPYGREDQESEHDSRVAILTYIHVPIHGGGTYHLNNFNVS